jgi:hypothetical protein
MQRLHTDLSQLPNDDVAEQNHWSERGRATSVANADAPGRPHRSVPALGAIRMWWLVLLIGIPFVAGALYGIFDSCRRLQGARRVVGMLGGILLATGGGAFFSIALASASLGVIPASFEWPIGCADQIIQLPDGHRVATHTPSGRMQVYDHAWHFVRAWPVDAGGGVFKVRLTATGLLEVWTARGRKRLVFEPDGRLVESGSYAPASYSDLGSDARSGYVPTAPPLWIFAHPFVAWAVGVVGMAMLGLSDPRRLKR